MEGDAAGAQHAADDLADAPESGNDHAWRLVLRQFVVGSLVFRLPALRDDIGGHDQQRRGRHRQHDAGRQQVTHVGRQHADAEAERQQHESELAAL